MIMSGATRTSSSAWQDFSNAVFSRWLGEGFLSLLFPPRCLRCGAGTARLEPLCASCVAQLPALEGLRCWQCQDRLEDPRVDLCRACGTRDRGFDLARSLGPYDGGWDTLVQALKFGKERAVARFLAKKLAAHLAAAAPFGDFGMITYVPMSRRDRRRRGVQPSPAAGKRPGSKDRDPGLPDAGQGAGNGSPGRPSRTRAAKQLARGLSTGKIRRGKGSPRG